MYLNQYHNADLRSHLHFQRKGYHFSLCIYIIEQPLYIIHLFIHSTENDLETVAQLRNELSRIQRYLPETKYQVPSPSIKNEDDVDSLSMYSDHSVL